MTKKLTHKQVIIALRRLEKDWPDDLWLFIEGGTVNLMSKNEDGDRALYPTNGVGVYAEGVDPNYVLNSFDGIEADSGEW